MAGPAQQIQTVAIVHPSNLDKKIQINESDFDPTKHLLLRQNKALQSEEQGRAVFEIIRVRDQQRREKETRESNDPRDQEIKALRAKIEAMERAERMEKGKPAPVEEKKAEPAAAPMEAKKPGKADKKAEPAPVEKPAAAGGDSLAGLAEI